MFALFVGVLLLPGWASAPTIAVAHAPAPSKAAIEVHSPHGAAPAAVGRGASASCPTAVVATIDLEANTTEACNVVRADGWNPVAILADPDTGQVFVACAGTDNVAVIDSLTDAVTGWVSVGEAPTVLALDAPADRLFVAGATAEAVTEVDTSSAIVVANFSVDAGPSSLAFDNESNRLYVGSLDQPNITVLNASTGAWITNITHPETGGGGTPVVAMAISPLSHQLIVNWGSQNDYVVNTTNESVAGQFGWWEEPSSILVDPLNSMVYVTDTGRSNVTAWPEQNLTSYSCSYFPYCDAPNYYNGVVSPNSLTLDPTTGDIIVTGVGGTIAVLNATLGSPNPNATVDPTIVSRNSMELGAITGIAVASNNQVFLANGAFEDYSRGDNSIWVLNRTTLNATAVIPLGAAPVSLVADPTDHRLFSFDAGTGNLTVIDLQSWKILEEFTLRWPPSMLAFDPIQDRLVILGDFGESILYASNLTWYTYFWVGGIDCCDAGDSGYLAPANVVYDPIGSALIAPGTVYANLSRFDGTTLRLSISPFWRPSSSAYDASRGEVMVTGRNWSWPEAGVAWFNGTTFAGSPELSLGGTPGPLTVDAANHTAVVFDSVNGTSWIVNTSAATATPGARWCADPVDSAFGGGAYYVACEESGQVGFAPASGLLRPSNLSVGQLPDSLAFDPSTGTLFVANLGSGTISVISSRPLLPTFPVRMVEYGLPAGTTWTASLDGLPTSSANQTIEFEAASGLHNYSIDALPLYRPVPPAGAVAVNGTAAQVVITFVPSLPVKFWLNFTETGLLSNLTWTLFIDGAGYAAPAGSAIAILLPDGTYDFVLGTLYDFRASPASGTITIADSDVSQAINFTGPFVPGVQRPPYSVVFDESGLAEGTVWTVAVNGGLEASNSPSLNLLLENGSYNFQVTPITGFVATPPNGTFDVAGHGTNIALSFIPASGLSYSVCFEETGLPAGIPWGVRIGNQSVLAEGDIASTFLPNGSYAFTVEPAQGYVSNLTSGIVNVAGSPSLVSVRFSPSAEASGASPSNGSGIPWLTPLGLGIAAGVAIGATASIWTLRSRRPRHPRPSPV
ncbi:MAG: hypothetical protein L3K17_03820 [Thermoplasmata archaeon]|nr:hypothetical protein [Thermoplasmata archaeon]